MTELNSTHPYNDGQNADKVTINTLQRTVYVKRIAQTSSIAKDIITYDIDNLYPQKVRSIMERSGTTQSAVNTLANFTRGEGFERDDVILNRDNMTGFDILRYISIEKAIFKGFALHFNYSRAGVITEINPVNFESFRYNKDMSKLLRKKDWLSWKEKSQEYNIFNLDTVRSEIAEQGFNNYKGQILYWKPDMAEIYPLCRFDACIDDAQLEAEAKIYKLSNIQNDYSLGGMFILPMSVKSSEEGKDIEDKIKNNGKGSANAGNSLVVYTPISEGMSGHKYFVPTSRNNIDSMFTNQLNDARDSIYAVYNQPPILNGIAKNGMFNQESFKDAFMYYNSQTEQDRKDLERILSLIFSNSVFGINDIEIKPKQLIEDDRNSVNNE